MFKIAKSESKINQKIMFYIVYLWLAWEFLCWLDFGLFINQKKEWHFSIVMHFIFTSQTEKNFLGF